MLFTSHLIRQIPLEKRTMLLLLTLAAGSMDSVSYLGLGQVFPAMMTGNIVFLGLRAGQGDYLAASRGFVALLGFCLGVISGAAIVERKPRNAEWPISVTWALAVEALLLVIFVLLWFSCGGERVGGLKYTLILISSMAMGIQSAAVGYLGVPGITTTYITGTLTALMVALRHRLSCKKAQDRASQGVTAPHPDSRPSTSHMVSLATVVFFYAVGAFIGSVLQENESSIIESGFPAFAV
ncbi:MAG: DUF1275 domain-containing protein, partial [Candidatus Moranbacteria bacterium]|nr:DUF1275 domain-containing protein [Candidatus Moranbacteria bacterium]